MPSVPTSEKIAEALLSFASSGDDASFKTMIDSLGGLVFSSALRRTGDPSLAEEVTQNVFAILARKAKRVAKHPSPEGWIFTTTRLESAMAIRKQQQHQRKLTAFLEVQQIDIGEEDPHAATWQEALPHLNASLDRLGHTDREIILARFFTGNSFKEIAQRFNKSEAACKMRTKRSLEKMRGWMSKRGVSITAAALATGLGTEFARAIPAKISAALPAAANRNLSIGSASTNTLLTTTWLPLAATAVIATVVVWVASSQSQSSDDAIVSQPQERQSNKLGSALAPDLRKRQLIKLDSTDRLWAEADATEPKLRPGFWLRSVEIENASAKEALAQVREQYLEDGGDPAITFDFELVDDHSERLPITFSLGNVTLERALQRVGLEADADLDVRPGGYALTDFPPAGQEIETQTFRVPPDLLSRNGVTQAKDLLTEIPDTATLEFLPATSELLVTGDSRLRARITALVTSEISFVQDQVLLAVKSAYVPDDRFGAGGRILSTAETQSLVDEISEDQDCELIINPSTVTRREQTATVEALREVEIAGEQHKIGMRLSLDSYRVAYSQNFSGEVKMSCLGALTPSSLRSTASNHPSGEVQRKTISIDLTLDSGQSAIFELLTAENGERFMMIISPQLIDPAGRPISN